MTQITNCFEFCLSSYDEETQAKSLFIYSSICTMNNVHVLRESVCINANSGFPQFPAFVKWTKDVGTKHAQVKTFLETLWRVNDCSTQITHNKFSRLQFSLLMMTARRRCRCCCIRIELRNRKYADEVLMLARKFT